MIVLKDSVQLAFGAGLFVNALLFVPQSVRIIKEKSAKGVSLFTFLGLLLIQFTLVLYGIVERDYLLIIGCVASMVAYSSVAALVLLYRKKAGGDDDISIMEILNQIPVHVYWKDREGVFLGCNKSNWKDFSFQSLSDFKGKTDYDILSKNEADGIRRVDESVVRTGHSKIAEELLTSANGNEIVYLSHKVPLKNKKNKTVGLLGVSVDITARRQHETDRIEMLENVIAVMPGNVYWLDTDGVYMGCNDNQAAVIGLSSRKEIVGKRNADMPGFLVSEVLDKYNEQVIRMNQPITVEEPAVLPDGTKATFLSNKVPLRNSRAKTIGVIGISIDITDRKKQEEELEKAKKMAEESSRAKTEFLANMRQDLRTPLSGIVGFAELIQQTVKDPKVAEYANHLVSASHTLLDFLNEILETIKVLTDEMPDVQRKFSLSQTVNRIIQLTQPTAMEKGLQLNLEYSSKIPEYVIGDSMRIQRILLELISNALKFTEKGLVHIKIEQAKKRSRELVIKCSVRDTGIGIPPDKQEEIFLRFKRLTPSYQGLYDGAGLGLAIVKQFIDDLQGEIYCQGKEGEGSTFVCLIPLREPLLEGAEGSVETEGPKFYEKKATTLKQEKREETIQGAKTHVLVVEDQPVAAHAAKSLLERLSCSVDIAEDGSRALKCFQENHYDFIFMDMGLPDMNGNEVTKQMRSQERQRDQHVPIVALTAHVDEKSKQACIDAGMDAVLSKPLLFDTARAMINAFVPSQKTQKMASLKQAQPENLLKIEGCVLDIEMGMSQVCGDREKAKKMIEMLVEGFKEDKPGLLEAKQQDDWARLQMVAHKYRGSSLYCGVPRLQQVSARLDNYLLSKKTELREPLYQLFLDEMKKIAKAQTKI
jgi:two-component system, OmpR family, aerobic respiration control sensor histidine kinase ArcB